MLAVAETTIGTPGTGWRAAAIVTVLCALIVEPGRAVLVAISLSRISHGTPSGHPSVTASAFRSAVSVARMAPGDFC